MNVPKLYRWPNIADANLKQLAEAETVFVGTFHTCPEFSIGCLPFVPSRMAHSFHSHSSSYLTMLVVHAKDLYLPKEQVLEMLAPSP